MHLSEDCPIRRFLAVMGDRWTPVVIYSIGEEVRRYGELSRAIPGVSRKMLTQTLRKLERLGLLKRTVFPVVPPRVEYELTPMGKTFLEPVRFLNAWATAHAADLAQLERALETERMERETAERATEEEA